MRFSCGNSAACRRLEGDGRSADLMVLTPTDPAVHYYEAPVATAVDTMPALDRGGSATAGSGALARVTLTALGRLDEGMAEES